MSTQNLITDAAATGAGQVFSLDDSTTATFSAFGNTTSGSGAAVVNIYVSNHPSNFIASPLGTISLTLGTSVTSDGFAMSGNWSYVKAEVMSISGTNAKVTVQMGT